jgi:hypothetical protein
MSCTHLGETLAALVKQTLNPHKAPIITPSPVDDPATVYRYHLDTSEHPAKLVPEPVQPGKAWLGKDGQVWVALANGDQVRATDLFYGDGQPYEPAELEPPVVFADAGQDDAASADLPPATGEAPDPGHADNPAAEALSDNDESAQNPAQPPAAAADQPDEPSAKAEQPESGDDDEDDEQEQPDDVPPPATDSGWKSRTTSEGSYYHHPDGWVTEWHLNVYVAGRALERGEVFRIEAETEDS